MMKIFYTSLFLVFLIIYGALIYKGVRHANVDLITLETYSGKIVEAGEKYVSGGKSSHLTFCFQVEGSYQQFGVYRMNKNYESLADQLKIGDIVKVYYLENSDEINTDVVQIEKNGIIVLDKKEYIKKQLVLVGLGAVAGLFTFWLLWSYLKEKA